MLPTATTAGVEGWTNEGWLRVLRVRRVLDADGVVLFDDGQREDRVVEDLVDEVGTEYLDFLFDLTGDTYMSHRERAAP